jgi:flagellar biosynthesis/type III secretory pathway chaperone
VNALVNTRIESLLDQQIDAARSLAAILESERDALTGDSPEAVYENAAQKVRLLERFERLEAERRGLYAEAGMSPAAAPSQPAAQRWRILMGLLAACRRANEANGLIVNLKQGQIRQLLDIVRGGPSITYGPHGQTFAAAARPLARA